MTRMRRIKKYSTNRKKKIHKRRKTIKKGGGYINVIAKKAEKIKPLSYSINYVGNKLLNIGKNMVRGDDPITFIEALNSFTTYLYNRLSKGLEEDDRLKNFDDGSDYIIDKIYGLNEWKRTLHEKWIWEMTVDLNDYLAYTNLTRCMKKNTYNINIDENSNYLWLYTYIINVLKLLQLLPNTISSIEQRAINTFSQRRNDILLGKPDIHNCVFTSSIYSSEDNKNYTNLENYSTILLKLYNKENPSNQKVMIYFTTIR